MSALWRFVLALIAQEAIDSVELIHFFFFQHRIAGDSDRDMWHYPYNDLVITPK